MPKVIGRIWRHLNKTCICREIHRESGEHVSHLPGRGRIIEKSGARGDVEGDAGVYLWFGAVCYCISDPTDFVTAGVLFVDILV